MGDDPYRPGPGYARAVPRSEDVEHRGRIRRFGADAYAARVESLLPA